MRPTEIRVKDLKTIATPLVCRDQDDFVKLFFSVAMTASERAPGESHQDKVAFNIEGMRILLHEYLALVLKGRLEPYSMGFGTEKDQEDAVNAFRESMLSITERLAMSGVPLSEEDGRAKIMFDELKKMGEKEFENEV